MYKIIEKHKLATLLLVISAYAAMFSLVRVDSLNKELKNQKHPSGNQKVMIKISTSTKHFLKIPTSKSSKGLTNKQKTILDTIRKDSSFVYTSLYKNESTSSSVQVEKSSYTSHNNIQVSQNAESKYFISVTMKVLGETYNLSVPPNLTLLDLMNATSKKAGLTYKTKDYGATLGKLVTSINGLEESKKDKKYWVFYVNEEWSKHGVSKAIVKNNDIIEWRYE